MFIDETDIVLSVYSRKRHWFHGDPKITLKGETKKFGVLSFDFGDEVVKSSIYIKDREAILDIAHKAIQNFNTIIDDVQREWCEDHA